jgi:hypothetical protein
MFVIVKNEVERAINVALDRAISECPESAGSRESLYGELLRYFDECGVIPEFSLYRLGEEEPPDAN